eukprot:COSAG01_NODE_71533_length_255_cov_1.326923_1_plen_42_part_10
MSLANLSVTLQKAVGRPGAERGCVAHPRREIPLSPHILAHNS